MQEGPLLTGCASSTVPVCQSKNSHAAAAVSSSSDVTSQGIRPALLSLAISVWAAQVKIDWIRKRLGDARMGRIWV